MREVSASEFKAKCLRMLDELDAEGLVITKHGKPVAKVMPLQPDLRQFIGILPDILVDPDIDLLGTGEVWEAELPDDPDERKKFIAERRATATSPRTQS